LKLAWLLLLGVIADLALILYGLSRFSVVREEHASVAVYPILLLAIYFGVAIAVMMGGGKDREMAIKIGTSAGLFCGLVLALTIAVEHFVTLRQPGSTVVAIGSMILVFSLFGVAGYVGAAKAERMAAGVMAAVWAAMLAIVITCFAGFTFNFMCLDKWVRDLAPAFLRSGMSSPQAFTFVNSLENATSHLFVAPFVALITGSLGSAVALRQRRAGA
jgi:thiamine transporter ThiT